MWIPPVKSAQGMSLPDDVARHSDAWRSLHPNFSYKMWSLEDVLSTLARHDLFHVNQVIVSCRIPAMQADIARLAILLIQGGFWADLKLSPRSAFLNELTDFRLVVTEHFPKENLPDPNGFLLNSFLGAEPAHPVIADALNRVVRNVRERQQGSIFYITGSTNLKDALAAHPGEVGSHMLPHQTTWNVLFDVGGASYNENGMHWSVRETREPLYI